MGGLCFIQPFLALMRCSPTDRMRPLFNWVHWFIGNSAQILGIVAIFYAVDLTKAELPRPHTDWLLVAFVAFHFLTHLLLSCISCVQEQNQISATDATHVEERTRLPGLRGTEGRLLRVRA